MSNQETSRSIRLTFANARGDAVYVGPLTKLVFHGHELKDGDRQLVAVHADHKWLLPQGQRYSRLECYSPCLAWFEDPKDPSTKYSRKAGPFSTLSAVDGVVYGDQRVVAFCDSQLDDWYSFDFGQHWKCMVVVPLETPGGT